MDIINKEKILEHAKKLTTEGKFDRAITEYEQILKLDPEDLRVKIRIAELYIKRKQIQDSIRIYQEVAQKYESDGFYLKAATIYKNILRLNPSLVDINKTLAALYEKMGLIQDALYQYQIVSTALERKNNIQGQTEVREKMVSLDPANINLRIRLAESYQLQGETGKALDMYEVLAEQIKNSKDINQLVELYNKILAHRPEKHELLRALCQIHYKRGEWKEIIKKMDVAKEFIAKDAELLAMQADVYARLNQVETAKHKYRDLAALLVEAGDISQAVLAYENLLFWGPEEEEDIKKTVEEMQEGVFAEISKRVTARRDKLAEEEVKREEDRTSLPESGPAGQAKKDEPQRESAEKDTRAAYDLGMAYKKVGLTNEAKAEFSKALPYYQRLAASGDADAVKKLNEMGEPTQPKNKEPDKQPSKKKISFV